MDCSEGDKYGSEENLILFLATTSHSLATTRAGTDFKDLNTAEHQLG